MAEVNGLGSGNNDFFVRKIIAENNLRTKGIEKPTLAEVLNEMVANIQAEKAKDELPQGFTFYRQGANQGAGDVPTPPTEPPTDAPVYGPPDIPTEPPVTPSPTDITPITPDPTPPVEPPTEAPIYGPPDIPTAEPVTPSPTDVTPVTPDPTAPDEPPTEAPIYGPPDIPTAEPVTPNPTDVTPVTPDPTAPDEPPTEAPIYGPPDIPTEPPVTPEPEYPPLPETVYPEDGNDGIVHGDVPTGYPTNPPGDETNINSPTSLNNSSKAIFRTGYRVPDGCLLYPANGGQPLRAGDYVKVKGVYVLKSINK